MCSYEISEYTVGKHRPESRKIHPQRSRPAEGISILDIACGQRNAREQSISEVQRPDSVIGESSDKIKRQQRGRRARKTASGAVQSCQHVNGTRQTKARQPDKQGVADKQQDTNARNSQHGMQAFFLLMT